jgi:hypothetical protein
VFKIRTFHLEQAIQGTNFNTLFIVQYFCLIGFDIESEQSKNGLVSSELELQDKAVSLSASASQAVPAQILSNLPAITSAPPTHISGLSSDKFDDVGSIFYDQEELAVELGLSEDESSMEPQPYQRSKRAAIEVDGLERETRKWPFPSRASATRHHQKHGGQYGGCSLGAYCRTAANLSGQSTPHTYRRSNGDTVKYFSGSNDYVVTNRSNQVVTLFKPNGGLDYFQRDKANNGR